ncbi:putative V-type proton ATPase subunit c''2 [Monocercomonoides exilis]|uniref:putative V-type proton ATPase subunit c''2 n=1 Tax=Monocercomonoides exilis TaxID=2049356 RepID=UPI00355A6B88|nr:putative V-type proton ATPase subunit c''2 [Monocercomonoides exilis]
MEPTTAQPWDGNWLIMIDPYLWAALGACFAIGFSVLGAGWGIFMTGASLVGNAVRHPRITSKNLISVLFCEALAIYGIILAIIVQNKYAVSPYPLQAEDYKAAYAQFFAGLIIGCSNVGAGYCVGKLGAAIANADAADGSLFMKCFVMEIFGEAIGLMGVIVSVIMSSSSSFRGAA